MRCLHSRKDKSGQQAIEYILLVIAVVLVVIAIVNNTKFKQTVNGVLDAPSTFLDKMH